ncbi:hypothetical protein PBY51_008475 [Eleginops maclovinus]|uniref:Uncharacterized protein n=1 Tax=Eleginops maclovinus TaxID=56733 RepID=A0AAN7WU40_ELEMC|nr:hypothetical protein PBY51_008475 [Eleginops maclovinus]
MANQLDLLVDQKLAAVLVSLQEEHMYLRHLGVEVMRRMDMRHVGEVMRRIYLQHVGEEVMKTPLALLAQNT